MAATEDAPPASGAPGWGSVVCAALALPGLAVAAEMDVVAGQGLLAVRWLSYRDRQPGLERIRVDAPSLQLNLPVGSNWSVDAIGTRDSVSGASPRWHSAISGASRMSDRREALDLRVTRHAERSSASLALARSDEHDYRSRALTAEWRTSSDDQNRSWQLGAGLARDRIGSSDDPTLDERRRTRSLSVGVSQVLSRTDVAQATLSHATGQGYFSDPYKALDARPRARHQTTLVLRWNHHVEALDASLRSRWRIYVDSFGVRAHSVDVEWAASLTERVSLSPSLRYHTQSAAWFYYDPVYSFLGEPYPPGWLESPPRYLSPDARLSAFGAWTLGIKLAVQWTRHWSTDLKLQAYEQRGAWRAGGHGSPGLAPLKASVVQVGFVHRF